jgi:hypothetical protein
LCHQREFRPAAPTARDPLMHLAVYVRVAMLACAVAIGFWILRGVGGEWDGMKTAAGTEPQ